MCAVTVSYSPADHVLSDPPEGAAMHACMFANTHTNIQTYMYRLVTVVSLTYTCTHIHTCRKVNADVVTSSLLTRLQCWVKPGYKYTVNQAGGFSNVTCCNTACLYFQWDFFYLQSL